jgi:hypothetical protein
MNNRNYLFIFSILDNELDDNDLFIFTRYKPGGLDNLCKATHFNKKEIRLMYQGFKQVSFKLNLEYIRNIFCKFSIF